MAASARGLGPRGFSLEASLTMRAGSSPSSRATSSIGLPPTYGESPRTYCGAWAASAEAVIETRGSGERSGVRAQQLEERRALAELGERSGDGRVLAVPGEVHEEQVFPQAGARRARLEARHRHAVLRERLEQRMDRART